MKVYALQAVQELGISLPEAWDFFSSPYNLKTITPPFMGFDITNDVKGQKMYPGMIITYKVRPLLNIPLNWMTEITHVQEPHYFVDEQRFGPYAFWHHKHFFKEIPGGVEMTDLVHYAIPFGILGRIALPMVRGKLKGIFDFRRATLEKMFPVK